MNYIKPEDIKEYVSKNPTGIAGMSGELTAMVNHFAELLMEEVMQELFINGYEDAFDFLNEHFGVEE